MLTVEKITTREEFDKLGQEWNSLLEESASNTLTLTWEWLSTWWEVFCQGRELYTLVARDGSRVVGIAPLLRRTVHRYGVLPFRRLEFLASGEDEADEICSEYLDFILRRGREEEAIEAIFRHLRDHQSEWDEILLTDIRAEALSLSFIRRLCQESGARLEELRNQTCIYVTLPADMETLLRSVSPAFRQRIRKDRRVAVEIGAELKVIDGAEGFDQDFDALIRLHQKRWRERGEPGVFSSEKFTRFHRRLASRIIPKRWARLFTLSIKGEPVAALYDFVYEGKMYYYQSGLDLESGQLRSPGLLVRAYAIETAIKEGLAECDFLKGDIRGYKAGWRGQTRSVLQLRLARSHSKEAIYTVATRLVDGLRQVKRTIKSAAALAMSLSVTLRNL